MQLERRRKGGVKKGGGGLVGWEGEGGKEGQRDEPNRDGMSVGYSDVG